MGKDYGSQTERSASLEDKQATTADVQWAAISRTHRALQTQAETKDSPGKESVETEQALIEYKLPQAPCVSLKPSV